MPPTPPQRKWAHQEPSGTGRTRKCAWAAMGPEPSTCPAIYYLGTINKRSSTSQLAHFKTEGRPSLLFHRLGTNSQLYKHARHLTLFRTQQMLHTHTKKIYPPRLSRANQETALPTTASDHQGPHFYVFSAGRCHPMPHISSFTHMLPLSLAISIT